MTCLRSQARKWEKSRFDSHLSDSRLFCRRFSVRRAYPEQRPCGEQSLGR